MRNISISGHTLGYKVSVTLTYMVLIMGICRRACVGIPMMVRKVIKSVVNDGYVEWHCMLKLDGNRAPQPQAMAPSAGPVRYNEQFVC
ncbi:hypothetical protein RYX36_021786, partial [Vicia faba]